MPSSVQLGSQLHDCGSNGRSPSHIPSSNLDTSFPSQYCYCGAESHAFLRRRKRYGSRDANLRTRKECVDYPVGLCHEKQLKSRVSLHEPSANINIGAPKGLIIIDRFQIRYVFLGLGRHQSQRTVNTI